MKLYDELTAFLAAVWIGVGGLAVLVLWALIEGGWL